ncbi:MAG: methylmalonyl Co-A mutase-associated GTPase MeaB [Actinomycetota bacterium]|nr:methylmalonyl Co-A mutase-associated GTPase MeaB [Actinomycetota bacterium]
MPDASELAAQVLVGDLRSASRLISLLEREDERAADAVAELFPSTGSARAIGITGPPGAGKSTLIKQFIDAYRERGLRVGVLAIDPSSQRTGGALLGDRLRMVSHTMQEGVFIRSMAVRDQQGGIALSTTQAMRVLDALGCDRLIVETVGVGQSEIAVASTVDCTVLVSHPGAGDEIQAMKSGIMEIGDLYVINKADQPGAEHLRRQLRSAVRMLAAKDPPRQVYMVSARTGDGVAELVEAVETRLERLEASGTLGRQRLLNLQQEVVQLIVSRSVAKALSELGPNPVATYLTDLDQRRLDPSTVASLVLGEQPENRSLAEPSVVEGGTEGAA